MMIAESPANIQLSSYKTTAKCDIIHDSRPVHYKSLSISTPDTVAVIDDDGDYSGLNSSNVDSNYRDYPRYVNSAKSMHSVKYQDVINYGRCTSPKGISHHCVMCGSSNVNIPQQNKDVCRSCDTSFWLYHKLNIVVKFCKGT